MPIGINLFGSANTEEAQRETLKETVREWSRKLRSEARTVERDIRRIERDEDKIKKDAKAMAKRGGDPKSIQLLAKSLVRSGKAKTRLYNARATLQATASELQNQAASMRLGDSIRQSTQIMQQMNSLVNINEIQETMTSMRKEMMHAGIIEEIMDEGMEDMDGPELEEEAETEVRKVFDELGIDAAILLANSTRPTTETATAAHVVTPAVPLAARAVMNPAGDGGM